MTVRQIKKLIREVVGRKPKKRQAEILECLEAMVPPGTLEVRARELLVELIGSANRALSFADSCG